LNEKILIVGSNGILGKHMVEKAIKYFGIENLVLSDYKPKRLNMLKEQLFEIYGVQVLTKLVNVHSKESINQGLKGIDFVIISMQQKSPDIQKLCLERGINSIDVSVNPFFVSKVLALNSKADNKSIQIVMGGLFPGLSGLMVKELFENSGQNEVIDIGLLQSANGTNGKTGVSDMLQIFDQQVEFFKEETTKIYPGYSHKQKFDFPLSFGVKTLRLANFKERDFLKLHGIKSNFYTSFNKEGFNRLISTLKKLGFLKLFMYPKPGKFLSSLFSKQDKGEKNEFIGLSAKNSLREISLVLSSDYEATASCTMAFIKRALKNKGICTGVKFPFEIFTFKDIKTELKDVILEMNESDYLQR
jgi:saccharopine dehydrogenase-like NADP-dependent oxidoreductase